jgi:hypothetical protein
MVLKQKRFDFFLVFLCRGKVTPKFSSSEPQPQLAATQGTSEAKTPFTPQNYHFFNSIKLYGVDLCENF